MSTVIRLLHIAAVLAVPGSIAWWKSGENADATKCTRHHSNHTAYVRHSSYQWWGR